MKFNVRVYGLLIHQEQVLVTDEDRFGIQFTKFPGGGLEFKEGTIECLEREFQEELNISIHTPQLFHINENFVESAFNSKHQMLSIYYIVESDELQSIKLKEKQFDFEGEEQIFRMIPLAELNADDFRFPIDKAVVHKILEFHS